MVTPKLETKLNYKGKIAKYVISILYKRPEFGESCEFLSTYVAMEERGARYLKGVFVKAFKLAHPTWVLTKIKVIRDQPS